MSLYCLISVLWFFRLSVSSFVRNIPENGIGNLLISSDDSHKNYNYDRLLFIFDYKCLLLQNKTNQQSKIHSIISNHFPCLTHHFNENNDHFIQYNNGYAMSFLNINDNYDSNNNNDNSCINDKSINFDYDSHCIHSIAYEPIFELNFELNNDYIKNTKKWKL